MGYNDIMTRKAKDDIVRFYKRLGYMPDIDFEVVKKYNYKNISETLERIVENNPEPVFDLTGGSELVLAAMGEISAMHNIPMLQFDVKRCRLINVKGCEVLSIPQIPKIKIRDSVILNGGDTVIKKSGDFVWDINSELERDINILWDICKNNSLEWNRQTSTFARLEQFSYGYDGLCIDVDMATVSMEWEKLINERIMLKLVKHGLISGYSLKGSRLSFKYKNAYIKRCVQKAGNVLELYTYITAKRLERNNLSEINDVKMGVMVDWDGKFYSEYSEVTEIRNEIDVMLMNKLVPVFISCKNGEVHKESLYELDTVAEHYGGNYANKILVATYVSADENSRSYIIKRAEEMNITIIDGVNEMDSKAFYNKLSDAIL